MKNLSKKIAIIAIMSVFATTFSACTDITQSSKYQTYSLKYLVNLSNIPEEEKERVIEIDKAAIKSRINYFDVAELKIEDEEKDGKNYITVNFGTIDDINDIKKRIEKDNTFNLKKQIEDLPEDSDYEKEMEEKANSTLQKLINGADFEITAQNEVLSDPERIMYIPSSWMYRDEIKEVFAEKLFDMDSNTIYPEIISYEDRSNPFAPPVKVKSILKLKDKKEVERVNKSPKEVKVSHILVAYKDALRASSSVTRTQEEAKTLAEEILEKINNGEDFAELAKKYSDDESNNKSGGVLGTPAGKGVYVKEFEDAALALENEGDISPIIETSFGYHIIKAMEVTPAKEDSHMEEQVLFDVIFYLAVAPQWEKTDFVDKNYIKSVNIIYDENYDPYLIIKLNEDGKNALENLTKNNIDKVIGVFAGNQLITSFTVKEVNSSGEIKILQPTKTKEADRLKDLILMKKLAAPLIFIEET
jgi:parvulin-like peptidyl-prolyl isomerase